MKDRGTTISVRALPCLLLVLMLSIPGWAQLPNLNGTMVPDINVNDQSISIRQPTASQQAAAADFFKTYGAQALVRFDAFSGSVDTLLDFQTASLGGDAASAALQFVSDHRELFGVTDLSTLKASKVQPALGGYLVRLDQYYQDVPVSGGGMGLVLTGDREVIAAFGPYFAISGVSTSPVLTTADAVARARAELSGFTVPLSQEASDLLAPSLQLIENSLGPFREPSPQLTVFPMADGYRLAWDFYLYSSNPFGVFRYTVDAETGQTLSRQNQVRAQATGNLVPATADVYPQHPAITPELQDQGIIAKGDDDRPLGQLRVNLRNFDASNTTTGAAGELTGKHATVHNGLAVKLPFPQAALNTWHFAQDMQPVEQTTREDVHWGVDAEPAEHQDEANIFFFVNYLLEYVTDLHIRDDNSQDPLTPGGSFPDDFPNKDVPLQAIVHIPVLPGLNCTFPGGSAPCPQPDDPQFAEKMLGLDNAYSLPLTTTVAGQQVIVNPTAYGHGFLFNDLAVEDGVPYHEGMHSISTPIAGFEGSIEGDALNEAQADLWASTITQDASLGEYVVSGFRLRQAVREGRALRAANGDPDLVAWIRNANSGLLYSQLCRFNSATRAPDGNACEEHQDGEIYLAAMWDIRELLQLYETSGGFLRPDLITGEATTEISQAQETWERLFLGTIYVLGVSQPDTFVRARDAMIVADSLLYPSSLIEPGNPRLVGMHRTLIEQVFAAREMGFNAKGPLGGRQTISTAVSSFAAGQPALLRPKGLKATVFGDAVQVSWKPVSGALAYEVVKRHKGQKSGRLYPADPATHVYAEGDAVTDGSGHVEYIPAWETAYIDRGQIVGLLRPRGLENPKDFQYGVRTLNLNPDNTIGVSDVEFVDANTSETVVTDTEVFTGLLPVGTAGLNLVDGVDHVDIPFEGKPGSFGVEGTLTVGPVDLTALPDLDLYLYQVGPNGELTELDSDGILGSNERVSAAIVPGGQYMYRIVGFANAGTEYRLQSDQFIVQITQ